MSDHHEQAASDAQQEGYGSGLAQMFGYVTTEDRQKWEQHRAQNKKRVGAQKSLMRSGVGSMMEFGEKNVGAKLNAAHRVAEQERFNTSHSKTTTRDADGELASITETVSYHDQAEENDIEPDFGV